MNLDKLVYDIKEAVSAISDDRYLDERYITHLINQGRAEFIKKLLSNRPGYNAINLEQHYHVNVISTSRSIFPGLTISCKILRSENPVPKLIDSDMLSRSFRVRTADILKDTIEVITPERANMITFEFPVMYAFLDYEHYLYLISPNNHQELRYAVVSGIFEDPTEVDDSLTDYPLSEFMWPTIKNNIIAQLLSTPMRDPYNNSEADYVDLENVRKQKDRQEKAKE